jgi:putative hemolysin
MIGASNFLPGANFGSARLLARRGSLSVVISRAAEFLRAAQELRYKVFHQELSAASQASSCSHGDGDDFDAYCDHILVIDESFSGMAVGTYRVLHQEWARARGGFYSENEFDLRPLFARHLGLTFFELGRSCVLASHRTGPVIELLWQGIWNYVRHSKIDVLFGCASLQGADPINHELQLSYLAHHFAAPEQWKVRPLTPRFVSMNMRAPGSYDVSRAARALPPLIKGYIRLGCYIGEGAVVDRQFNTTDVFVLLPVANITARYLSRFGTRDEAVLSC